MNILIIMLLVGIPFTLLLAYIRREPEYNNVPEYCPLCKKQLSWTKDSMVYYCKNCLEYIEIKVRWCYENPVVKQKVGSV